MIYFFSRGHEFVQCEIYPGRPHVLTLIAPDGAAESERYASTSDLQERWAQLSAAIVNEGWSGPFGRDPRS